ncbi:unnamed protein product, partial [Adineta steineri]
VETKPSIVEEIPIIKTIETPSIPIAPVIIEKSNDIINSITDLTKNDNDSTFVEQSELDSTITNKKPTTNNTQRKTTKDQQSYYQDQRYQNQQAPRHRNNYAHSMQEYESMQMNTHDYYGTNRRTTRGGRNSRMQDLSGGYYYEHPQQRYNSRYNYSNEHYQQHPTRTSNKTTKRGGSSSITDRQQTKQKTNSGSNSTSINIGHQSVSDNEQKEGEEWETASESSANMRNSHHDTNQQAVKSISNEIKSTTRDRTPPKKSFSSQRPLSARYNESGTHRRAYNLYERGNKTSRGITTHRTSR